MRLESASVHSNQRSLSNTLNDTDVILAVGTRQQNFTKGSWTAFSHDASFISINVGRRDAGKHRSSPVVVNAHCDPDDRIVTAAGGLPAEVTANWCNMKTGTVDVDFCYERMGYEIAGGRGARVAQSEQQPLQDTIVFTGDSSYLMLNSDLYSSVLTGKNFIVLVLDNGGFAVINKLQNNTGNESYKNLF